MTTKRKPNLSIKKAFLLLNGTGDPVQLLRKHNIPALPFVRREWIEALIMSERHNILVSNIVNGYICVKELGTLLDSEQKAKSVIENANLGRYYNNLPYAEGFWLPEFLPRMCNFLDEVGDKL